MKYLLITLMSFSSYALEVASTACTDGDVASAMVCKNKSLSFGVDEFDFDAENIAAPPQELEEIKKRMKDLDKRLNEFHKKLAVVAGEMCIVPKPKRSASGKWVNQPPKRVTEFTKQNDPELFSEVDKLTAEYKQLFAEIGQLKTDNPKSVEVEDLYYLIDLKNWQRNKNTTYLYSRTQTCYHNNIDDIYADGLISILFHACLPQNCSQADKEMGFEQTPEGYWIIVKALERQLTGNKFKDQEAYHALSLAYNKRTTKKGVRLPDEYIDEKKSLNYRALNDAYGDSFALYDGAVANGWPSDEFGTRAAIIAHNIAEARDWDKSRIKLDETNDNDLKKVAKRNKYYLKEMQELLWFDYLD
jgi:hypothetical protein